MPRKVLIFDTETTGMVEWGRDESDASQPHLIQLGIIVVDTSEWEQVTRHSLLVQLGPDVEIHPGAQEAHGIDAEKCRRFGVPLATACELFRATAQGADTLVAHNLKFDRIVMKASFIRSGMSTEWMDSLGWACTMEAAAPVLQLPGRGGKYKWPTLAEAYLHFSGKPLEGAHDALVDSEACLAVFRGLLEQQAISI